ncbi:podocalyxin [Mesocricetus auratus]|uniref:Podocalyxin n=1 Tax=Mesocricetus auratus TaxID=10036 RepID=A0A1U8CYQ4_MESAU|nr:podocalyxin [Mesocricetus auratus]
MEGWVLSGTPRLWVCAFVQGSQHYGGSRLIPRKSGRSFLLCLLFAAQRPPSRRPARPAAAVGELLGEGAEASADGTGRESSLQRAQGRSRSDTARAAATFASGSWLRAPAQICGRQEGPPERDSGVRGCRQASPSGADAPATQTSDPAPAPQPPAPSPGARTTMGPTLALSPLLLLLLLLPPSLCETTTAAATGTSATTKTASNTADSPTVPSNQDPPAAESSTALTKTTGGPVTTTLSPAQPATTSPKGVAAPSQSPTLASTSPTGSSGNQSGDSSTTPPSGSQDVKTNTITPAGSTSPTGNDGHPVSPGGKNDSVTTAPAAAQGSGHLTTKASFQPPSPLTTSKAPPASATNSTASSHQPLATPSHTTESPSTVVSNSSDSVSSSNFSVSPGKPTTNTSPGTSKGTPPPVTSQTPGFSTLPLSTPRQTTGSPVGTEITPTTQAFTHSSSNWTPTAPQGRSTPSPIWTRRDYKLQCDAAITPSEELLILNLTGASLCEGGPPDEKLVELLCHSVKASFKPAQDQCTLQVAPVLESRAVAVKRVIIETKLSPEVVFERLKDKWDDLREAGVSDMMLGREGPPEANEDRFSLPLIITIVCMASFLLLVAALYGCCHQRVSQRKDQQRLTEELQTVENGYHDNPTLEVMETPSEMQEKKAVNLNGELGDSWIVPLDNLTKDDLDEEEDTHL